MRCVWVLLILLATPAAADEIQVIELKNRTVEEIIPIVSPLLERSEAITGTGYKLILRASPQTVDAIKRILSKLDAGLHNLLISVRQGDATALDRTEASAGVRIDSESGAAAAASVVQGSLSDQWQGSQRIRVLEGNPAYIHTGVVLFAPDVIHPYGGVTHGQRDIGTGVYVVPRLNGTRVNLEISPYREALTGRGHTADIRNVSTVVSGQLGEWIFIGGARQAETSTDRGILSGANATAASRYGVQVRVDIAE